MQMQSSQPSATPQQAAMRVLRERYERGEIAFESFRRGLDALLLARNADECQVILNGLPQLPISKLDHLDALSQPSTTPAPLQRSERPRRLVAFFSQVKRMNHAWRLDPNTTGGAIFGEMDLDLNLAALPSHVTMTLSAVFGNLTIYVPATARVRVRSSAFMGGMTVFGEWSGGIFVSDETMSAGTTPEHAEATTIDLEVRAFFGEVKIIHGENPSLFKKFSTFVRRMIAEPEPGRLSNQM
ncbi:MAG: LiaF domain-containing protein [Nitrososphaerota archaeon]